MDIQLEFRGTFILLEFFLPVRFSKGRENSRDGFPFRDTQTGLRKTSDASDNHYCKDKNGRREEPYTDCRWRQYRELLGLWLGSGLCARLQSRGRVRRAA